MQGQIDPAWAAEAGGFAGPWVRDVPLCDPTFGDALITQLLAWAAAAPLSRPMAIATVPVGTALEIRWR
ncbi:MAG: hypothetical protein QOI48_1038 [Solirubrobacteraceae bacterium]|jgi:alkanesulfonate monooxygenase SsuD/methylene tetrahydromethanopterin reductase-like flavin-dependent oxidoreductase (luciferase family)|nr:hypothetical protein [Solirubrobacteraceae bacterium]